jgi:hypothetical protein
MAVNDIVMSAAGGSTDANYIESCFSTYLYTGNDSTQTITNGIDLSGKGGLVWMKERSTTGSHELVDTARGAGFELQTNNTSVSSAKATGLTAFTSSGFSLGTDSGYNGSGITFASWTFREQPKFFDIVTYTGDGVNNRTIAHNLGSTPGCVIIKRTDATGYWSVGHIAAGGILAFNSTSAQTTVTSTTGVSANGYVDRTDSTSTTFLVKTGATDISAVNASGGTYVAYLFAHNAGGFGATGTDNVISCGTFTTDGSGNTALQNLGYEPQFLMTKVVSDVGNWLVQDNMRGFVSSTSGQRYLYPNLSNAESGAADGWQPTATGFEDVYASQGPNRTYIYIAIRRPMKTPTTGTEVFIPLTTSGTEATRTLTSNFVVDLDIAPARTGSSITRRVVDRLRGRWKSLSTDLTNAESTLSAGYGIGFDINNGVIDYISTNNVNAHDYVNYLFRRAAGFFDIVCYTGTGASLNNSHNLGVAPELIIIKERSEIRDWGVLFGFTSTTFSQANLNLTLAPTLNSAYGGGNDVDSQPTSSVFNVSSGSYTYNKVSQTYVAYLFATVAGVSKVGNYTGNGSTQTINCGFTTGARFVLIKRTDSTGDWYVWDSARGIVAGNDPHLSLNTTTAEVTTNDSVDADSSGFIVNQLAATNVNVNAATYIFLAIA